MMKMPAWLVAALAALCGTLAFGEDAGAGEITEFSPLNVGSVELVAGASHSELREVAQASTNYTDAAVAGAVAYTTGVSNEVEAAQSAADANAAALSAHASDTNNPHAVTAAQVGALSVTKEDYMLFGLTFTRTLADSTLMWRGIYFGTNTNVEIDYNGVYAKSFPTNDETQITLTALRPWGFTSYDSATKTTNEFYLPDKGGTILTSESDSDFRAWKSGKGISAGNNSSASTLGVSIGSGAHTYGMASVAIGSSTSAGRSYGGDYATAIGYGSTANAIYSVGIAGGDVKKAGTYGIALKGTVTNEYATTIGYAAKSFVDYSFNLNTPDPAHFYFAATNAATARTLQSYLDERATTNDLADVKASIPAISATDATFSNAVLQVGIGTLGITTNDLQVVHDLANLPVGTSITTVGGLLAALAAGLVALKKSVSSLSAKVDDANAALEEVA